MMSENWDLRMSTYYYYVWLHYYCYYCFQIDFLELRGIGKSAHRGGGWRKCRTSKTHTSHTNYNHKSTKQINGYIFWCGRISRHIEPSKQNWVVVSVLTLADEFISYSLIVFKPFILGQMWFNVFILDLVKYRTLVSTTQYVPSICSSIPMKCNETVINGHF